MEVAVRSYGMPRRRSVARFPCNAPGFSACSTISLKDPERPRKPPNLSPKPSPRALALVARHGNKGALTARSLGCLRRGHRGIRLAPVPVLFIEQDAAESGTDALRLPRVLAAFEDSLEGLPRGAPISRGELLIDPTRYEAFVGRVSLRLTRQEFEILYLLAVRSNKPLRRTALAQQLGITADAPSLRRIDVAICRLRQKLATFDRDERIVTRHGLGYMFAFDEPEHSFDLLAESASGGGDAPATQRTRVSDIALFEEEVDAYIGDTPVGLTRREYEVLSLLAKKPGHPVTANEIAAALGLPPQTRDRNAVKTQIQRLRAKLQQAGSTARVVNVRARGWSVV